MNDIVDRIQKVAPSEIDKFEIDIKRRNDLTDDNLEKLLMRTFYQVRKDNLPPSQSLAWSHISKRLQSQ
jgi:predicted ATP-dependent protease